MNFEQDSQNEAFYLNLCHFLLPPLQQLLGTYSNKLDSKLVQGFFVNGAIPLEFFDYISLQIHDCVLQEQHFQNYLGMKTKLS